MASEREVLETGATESQPPDLSDMQTGRETAWRSALGRTSLITEAVYRLKNPEGIDETQHALAEPNNNLAIRPMPPAPENEPVPQRAPLQNRGRVIPDPPSDDKTHALQGESPDDMLLRLSNEFQPIVEPGWDTVIYIGPPPQEHQQDDHEYEYIKQHFSKPYLMNSQTLKGLESTKFTKFLGPMSARAERKLKKLGVHRLLPPGSQPKYYIDLRPMQDDDEALLMITELTCTPGILSWHLSHLASGVPKALINGKDDLNITSKPHVKSWIEVEDSETKPDFIDNVDAMDVEESTQRNDSSDILDLEPEYSTIRHYTAIERLLHSIAGNDPKLNSAAKLWTFFSIAKFFDCANNSKITVWIFNWLFNGNNSNFVQANPEVAYRMALGMHSLDILRTSFAMLVGERALMQAGSTNPDFVYRPGGRQVSTHGRMMNNLDDDEVNRIDHAAHSLTRRITSLFMKLATLPMLWTARSSEMTKFNTLRLACKVKGLVDDPYIMMSDYIRGELYQTLSQNIQEGDLMRLHRTKAAREFGWIKRSRSFADSYNSMPLPQRLLTQTFWSQLENYGIYQELERTTSWNRSHSFDGLSELAPDLNKDLNCVPKTTLADAITGMNQRLQDKTLLSDKLPSWYTYDKSSFIESAESIKPHDQYGPSYPPPADQEFVRALLALEEIVDPNIPKLNETHLQPGGFDKYFNYSAIARKHRRKGVARNVSLANVLSQLSMEIRSVIMRDVLTPGYAGEAIGIESEISISQMDILLCLNEDEWKYLPLWAGGLDDGSGGVFADLDVPDMEQTEGFRGGKLDLGGIQGGDGVVEPGYSMAGDSDDFDEVMTDDGISTVGKASRLATDGTTSAGASTVVSLDE